MSFCFLYRWTGCDNHVPTFPAGPPHDSQRAGGVERGGCHGILHLWLLNWGLFTLPIQVWCVCVCVFVLCDKAMVKSTVTSFSDISCFATMLQKWKTSFFECFLTLFSKPLRPPLPLSAGLIHHLSVKETQRRHLLSVFSLYLFTHLNPRREKRRYRVCVRER